MPGRNGAGSNSTGVMGSMHFKHLRVPTQTKTASVTPDARFAPYDDDKAKKKRVSMCTSPNGAIFDVSVLKPKEIADGVEMLVPLIRPSGCGPLAPSDEIVMRTYDRILEVRNEMRFTELGLAIGDRTFKRCYQQARRDEERYNHASDALRKEADKAGYKGVKFVFDNTKHTEGGQVFPGIRRAAAGEIPDGVLRKPEYAVQKAFEYLTDKNWHRYMLPVGCFFWEGAPKTNSWKDWSAGLVCGRNEEYKINPYSVAAADVLYLCNTIGYLERYMYVIWIILWAKSYGCNLLRFSWRPGCTMNEPHFRRFVTMERHFHLFGSIHMHRRVLEIHQDQQAGNWEEVMVRLDALETMCCHAFSVPKNTLASDFDNTIIRKTRTNLTMLTQVFPKCGKINDKPVSGR